MTRQACTCAPSYQCPACIAWGEKPPPRATARAPLHPRWTTVHVHLLSRHLMHYRRQHGLTQRQVAAQVGCSVRAIRDIEHRRTLQPKRWMLHALSTVLGVTIADTTHH